MNGNHFVSNSEGKARRRSTRCCVAGGGPAGMMLGYLLARAGVEVVVLEKHDDFLRDFRGDTVHPSTLRTMQELGLLEDFLRLPHQRLERLDGHFGKNRVHLADFAGLPKSYGFVAFMPQWDFLKFIAEKAKRFPHFSVLMGANVTELLRDGPRVLGVRAESHDGPLEVRAPLTIAADGRHSTVRELSGLTLRDLGAPIDVLWFRVPCGKTKIEPVLAHVDAGRILVTLDRGDYYQCAYVIAKGEADAIKARGIAAFQADVRAIVPELDEQLGALHSFDDVKLLTVMVNRLEQWSAPGVLCIGDAAHAMSPVGGVGINLAIQDAVAASNLLAEPLRRNRVTEDDLRRVQARRALPTRVTQALQIQAHERVLGPALARSDHDFGAPLIFRLATRSSSLRRLLGRIIGVGVRSEHVRTAEAAPIEHS
ncbi:MAG TPA: FAD-dependent oxidoreductase [Polyangiaceae bacterium]|nr:FAD-dependent oxidoreductase [Polyangiaceae bacterium]